AMRPWNVSCAHDDTYVFCYPVADESVGGDRTEPPAHLLRLHKALADERRLRILKLLTVSDRNLQELSDALGLAKSTAHHHKVLHANAFQVGLLSAVEFLPFILVGLPAGVWVDRLRRRPILIAGDLGRAVILGSIPLAYELHALRMWQLYPVAFLAGVCTVFF